MRQPMANDLRTIVSALSIANDLERMGDHATNVVKRSQCESIQQVNRYQKLFRWETTFKI